MGEADRASLIRLDAVYAQQIVRVNDLADEGRWPLFAARAAEAGVGSMLSLQLFVEGDDLGAQPGSASTARVR